MRVMILIKSTKDTEAGILPEERLFAEMDKFGEELTKAGVIPEAGAGLQPSSKGARVVCARGKRTVIDGPFAETKELVCGYSIWGVKSLEEAVDWVKRWPIPPGGDFEIEIRPLYGMEDLPGHADEIKEKEQRLRQQLAAE
jgi:hypothetical protein